MIVERLKEYIDYKKIAVSAFERSIGMSNASFGKSLKNKGAIGTDKLEKILSLYDDISPEWLLTGRGDMLASPTIPTFPNTPTLPTTPTQDPTLTTDPAVGTPYYDVDFLGGFSEIFNSQTTVPATNIIIKGFEKADLWCNVTGHSMEPKINHGDIIALRQCSLDDIQYGEIYAVVLDTIRTIKILRRADDPSLLRFVPINREDFDEQEFPLSRILYIYEVIGSISKFF